MSEHRLDQPDADTLTPPQRYPFENSLQRAIERLTERYQIE